MAGIVAWLLVPLTCAAESSIGDASASASVTLRVVIPPVFRVLAARPVQGGYEYRVWSNTRSVMLNGRTYHIDKAGESTLFVPTSPNDLFIAHSL
ncbi:hypothetical protein QTI66_30750 [Variovorax sp. J22R133]|uniref:hypothetical protein n=1 Tax=Variovorax brevis TaxID=3053503 RepID=UPI002574BFDD|nr:hypothetical protein [Variovorax sp. J22R133]MDM0116529.1 hypothetical protein [Variovorax sp. J22R133]